MCVVTSVCTNSLVCAFWSCLDESSDSLIQECGKLVTARWALGLGDFLLLVCPQLCGSAFAVIECSVTGEVGMGVWPSVGVVWPCAWLCFLHLYEPVSSCPRRTDDDRLIFGRSSVPDCWTLQGTKKRETTNTGGWLPTGVPRLKGCLLTRLFPSVCIPPLCNAVLWTWSKILLQAKQRNKQTLAPDFDWDWGWWGVGFVVLSCNWCFTRTRLQN